MVTTVEPVQTAITGKEDLGDLSRPEQALAQFYRALNSRDSKTMQQNWDNSVEAAMDNPLGGIRRGWDQIKEVYARLFQTAAEYQFEFWDFTLHIAGDVFWAVGRERGRLELKDNRLDLAIRTTRIFRRADGRWRQIHHHGSIEEPEMLQAYQEAVLGKK
jgi:ketosteroid isomerase-like protein